MLMDMNKNPSPTRSILLVALLVVTCFGLATSLRAQLVTWDISTAKENISPTISATGNNPDVSGGPLTAAAGMTPNPSELNVAGHFLFSPWQTGASPVTIANYFEFSITADPGFQINYATVGYSLAALSTPTWELRSSVDGYATSFGTHTVSLDAKQNPITDNVNSLGTRTGTVTFRLYGYNYDNTPGSSDGLANNNGFFGPALSGRNLVINGTTSAVPEPHQYAIIAGLGLLGFAAYRHRHRLSKPA
jgi:hypothetical protein